MFSKDTSFFIQSILSGYFNTPVRSLEHTPVGGGSINQAWRLVINHKEQCFCKINSVARLPLLFETEKNDLQLLAAQQVIRTPAVIACLQQADQQILLLEWVEPGLKTTQSWKSFGEQLAALHRQTWTVNGTMTFGLPHNNYMGALPQSNTPGTSWVEFFVEQRLRPQTQLAINKGLLSSKHLQQFEALYRRLPELFPPAAPALLHGDLWSGNFIIDTSEQPVLIDPAVYYGHPAMDLAMTTLFGGFDNTFYEAYHYHSPFPRNYREQWDICNLYPLLIHLNLFGSGYLREIEAALG